MSLQTSCLMLLSTAALALPLAAESDTWQLDPRCSSISFVTGKSLGQPDPVLERGYFRTISGTVDLRTHTASISVHLDTIKTGIGIRDVRVRDYVFKTRKYPLALIEARLSSAMENAGLWSDPLKINTPVTVRIAGEKQEVNSQFSIARSDTLMVVQTLQPIMFNAAEFGLRSGFKKIAALAGLRGIAYIVPVDVQLCFKPLAPDAF